MLAKLRLLPLQKLYYKQNRNKIYFSYTFSQLEAHFQSPCYSVQTCAARFASHLDSFKILYRVECCYTEYLLGIVLLSRVVIKTGILLGWWVILDSILAPRVFFFSLQDFFTVYYLDYLTLYVCLTKSRTLN